MCIFSPTLFFDFKILITFIAIATPLPNYYPTIPLVQAV